MKTRPCRFRDCSEPEIGNQYCGSHGGRVRGTETIFTGRPSNPTEDTDAESLANRFDWIEGAR